MSQGIGFSRHEWGQALVRRRLEQTDHCGLASIILGRWSPGAMRAEKHYMLPQGAERVLLKPTLLD